MNIFNRYLIVFNVTVFIGDSYLGSSLGFGTKPTTKLAPQIRTKQLKPAYEKLFFSAGIKKTHENSICISLV